MTRLSDIAVYEDSVESKYGKLSRRFQEEFQAYCKDCTGPVTEWVSYEEATATYLDHRRTVHNEYHHQPIEGR